MTIDDLVFQMYPSVEHTNLDNVSEEDETLVKF